MTALRKFTLNFIIILLKYGNVASQNNQVVKTNIGLIRGLKSADGKYSMYMGIPYATVNPNNPFGESIPHPGFDKVFDAYNDSAICPQVEEFNNTIVGSLDCLHINIYVPNGARSINRLPVLVSIYGGRFTFGFPGRYLYGPKFLIRHDIILVTFNYRVGPYGFLCLDIPEIPGNQGLKDQVLALKWIKNHIESFGGDSNKITISGISSGSACADLHLIYNKDIVFNQVILQSGSAMGPWVLQDSDPSIPFKIAKQLGFSCNDVKEAIHFLSTVDVKIVIAASFDLDIIYKPCVEKVFEGVERFITIHPLNTEIPRVKDIPILIGQTNDEGLSLMHSITKNVFEEELRSNFKFKADKLKEMGKMVRDFYIGDDYFNDQYIWPAVNFLSDFMFLHPTQRSIEKFFANGVKSLYQYMFSYNGNRNLLKNRSNVSNRGAAHADEIGYLFDVSYMTETPLPEDQLIIDRITTLWTNFVKYGNPTPEKNELLPIIWAPATKNTPHYLNIDTELRLELRPFHDRMAFWDRFYKLNKHFQNYLRDEL